MKRMHGKKLVLNRESLRHLDNRTLVRVAGGARNTSVEAYGGCETNGCEPVGGGGSNSTCDSDWKCDVLLSLFFCW